MRPFDLAWQILKNTLAESPMQPMPAMGYYDKGRRNAELFNQADIPTQQKLIRDRPEAFAQAAYNQNDNSRRLASPSTDPRISVPMSLDTQIPDEGPTNDYSGQASNLFWQNVFPNEPQPPPPVGMGQLTQQDVDQWNQQQ